MRICIAGSMHHTERMLEVKKELEQLGHEAIVSKFADAFIGKNDEEKEKIKMEQKMNDDAMREFWELLKKADALLVLNLERKGIPGYIGGNAFLEMGWAYILQKPIFLFNPIPDIALYKSEIEAMRPTFLHEDLANIG